MKVGQKGQITLPKHVRERFGLKKDTEVEVVVEDGVIVVRKRSQGLHPVDRMYGSARLKYADSVDEYIEEIRGR